ncbi:hypothetical protein EDC04DRAFT_1001445 [Pisolithus marmoratus]|nr:hypothetical protein EDC04DRAFT_1001445 [Pisolithus marmoratus]
MCLSYAVGSNPFATVRSPRLPTNESPALRSRNHTLSMEVSQMSWLLRGARSCDDIKRVILYIAEHFFTDDPWPQSISHYYLGTVPCLPSPSRCITRGLKLKVVELWHEQCILPAGRTWGKYKRAGRSSRSSVTPSHFPSHLRYPSFCLAFL